MTDSQVTDDQQQLAAIEARLNRISNFRDPAYQQLKRQHKQLQQQLAVNRRRRQLAGQISQARAIQTTSDNQSLIDLANSEIKELEAELKQLDQPSADQIQVALLEIRAGVGGDEAGLFAGDLYRMYQRYSDKQNWRWQLLSQQPAPAGGFKEVVVKVTGPAALDWLQIEAGVHRVQRVPETESQGRIHTSAASVAVLAEVDEAEVELDPKDLRIDTFRSSGHGGQSVNKTDSAVRISHLPSGLVVSCQNEKSQIQNRQQALTILRARLRQTQLAEATAVSAGQRLAQIGQADRSQKIRTYNFNQDRVTDHRLGGRNGSVSTILAGDLQNLQKQLRARLAEDQS